MPKSKPAPEPPVAAQAQVISIDEVHLDPANVRVHDERNKATIRASLARFGPGRSIVLDGNNVVRAGNGTVEQARQVGFEEVLVIEPKPNQLVAVRRPDWSPSEGTSYSIGDNTSTDQSRNDDAKLAAVLEAVRNEDVGLLEATGHTSDELELLLKSLADGALGNGTQAEDPGPQIDKAAELQAKWQTATGQLWVIPSKAMPGKEHRLLCGDSTKSEDVARVVGGEKVEAIISDPPYGIDFDTDYTRFTSGFDVPRKKHDQVHDDDKPFDPTPWLDYPAVILWGANCYCSRLPLGTFLVWDKRFANGTAMLSDAEVAWMKTGHGVYIFAETSQGFVRPEPIQHPTQKPVSLMRWCIEKSKAERIILDPFLGSGTTIVAAEQTGRLCRGIEIAPKYCAVILERLTGLGLEPRLALDAQA